MAFGISGVTARRLSPIFTPLEIGSGYKGVFDYSKAIRVVSVISNGVNPPPDIDSSGDVDSYFQDFTPSDDHNLTRTDKLDGCFLAARRVEARMAEINILWISPFSLNNLSF